LAVAKKCDKVPHASRDAAREAAASVKRKTGVAATRIYRCTVKSCRGWHWTRSFRRDY
jgi:hypothetical protein